jgi:hypothetical protein
MIMCVLTASTVRNKEFEIAIRRRIVTEAQFQILLVMDRTVLGEEFEHCEGQINAAQL